MSLPADSMARKQTPIATGVLDYFPDAIAAVARLSFKGNEKHNPGAPLHWSDKSTDHADCLIRHFLERGKLDAEMQESHTVHVAWRALAMLQREIDAAARAASQFAATPSPGPVVAVRPVVVPLIQPIPDEQLHDG